MAFLALFCSSVRCAVGGRSFFGVPKQKPKVASLLAKRTVSANNRGRGFYLENTEESPINPEKNQRGPLISPLLLQASKTGSRLDSNPRTFISDLLRNPS